MDQLTREELEIILKAFKICDKHEIKIPENLKDKIKEDYIKVVQESL